MKKRKIVKKKKKKRRAKKKKLKKNQMMRSLPTRIGTLQTSACIEFPGKVRRCT